MLYNEAIDDDSHTAALTTLYIYMKISRHNEKGGLENLTPTGIVGWLILLSSISNSIGYLM